MRRMNHMILFFLGLFSLVIFLISYYGFSNLNVNDGIQNLRWITSSLIQVYGAILAIAPVISLAFISFSSLRYPSELMKRLLGLFAIKAFLVGIIGSILMCFYTLVSLNSNVEDISELAFFFWTDVITIYVAVIVTVFLLFNIYETTGLDFILRYLRDNLQADDENELEKSYEDFHSLIYDLANKRNLTGLRIALESLFETVILNERLYDKMRGTLYDIANIFRPKNELNSLKALNRVIDGGYVKIVESNKIGLINASAQHMSGPYIKDIGVGGKKAPISFYKHYIEKERWIQGMNPTKIQKIIDRVLILGAVDLKSSDAMLFINIASFLLHGWESQSSENKFDFADLVSRYLIKMVNEFQYVSLDEVRSEDRERFNTLINELLQFKQQLNHKSPRFNIFLGRLEEFGRTGGTFFQYLHNELTE